MKQQKEIAVLIALLVVGAAIWYWNSRQNPIAAGASSVTAGYSPMSVENPAIRWWKVDKVRKTEYKGGGRDPFNALPPPPPPAKPLQEGDKGYVKPVPPPPPPLELPANMKFYGYGTVPNGTARRAFLSDGDEVYVLAEGDTLLGRFRILKIGNATLDFEEISSGRQGHTNLEEAPPSPST